jgi:hypothetical protein
MRNRLTPIVAIALMAFIANAAAETQVHVFYGHQWKEHYGKILTSRPAFDGSTPLEPTVIYSSHLEYATARLTRTDGARVSPGVAYVEVTGTQIKPLYIELRKFRAIELIWATDRILIIKRNIGHIAAIEEVIDVVDRRWLSQQSVSTPYN